MTPVLRSPVGRCPSRVAIWALAAPLITTVIGCGGSPVPSRAPSGAARAQSNNPSRDDRQSAAGRPAAVAPGTTLAPADFTETLKATGAKYVVIQVFQEACGPCMTEALRLTELADRWGKNGIAILGLGMDETADGARAFFEHTGERISYPLYHAPWFAEQQDVTMTPTVFLYSADGEQLFRTDPEQAERGVVEALSQKLAELLGRSP